jgi:hypothetical protein
MPRYAFLVSAFRRWMLDMPLLCHGRRKFSALTRSIAAMIGLVSLWCRSKRDFSDIGAFLRVAAPAPRSAKETAPESLAGTPPALLCCEHCQSGRNEAQDRGATATTLRRGEGR